MAASTSQPPPGGEPGKADYSKQVPAVEQATRVLFCLARCAEVQLSLTEICRRVDIHKSKGYAILNTLVEAGLAARNRDAKTYSLGPAVLFLSRSLLDKMDLKAVVAPYLEELAQAAQTTALLGLISSDHLFIVAKHELPGLLSVTIRIGHRYPLTWGAHGKAILAFLPAEQRERALARTDPRFSAKAPEPKVDPTRIEQEFAECRKLGYARDLGQMQPGIHAVSAPILGSEGYPIGCLILVGTFSPQRADAFGEKTAAAARTLSTLIGPTLETVYGFQGGWKAEALPEELTPGRSRPAEKTEDGKRRQK